VNGHNLINAKTLDVCCFLHGKNHRVDVGEHLRRRHPRSAAGFRTRLGARQLANSNLHAFHLGRRDGFGPQQEPSEELEHRSPLVIQLPDGLLRFRNDSRELRIEAYRQ
jgi:hypothetical protein